MQSKPSGKTQITGAVGIASGAGLAPLIVWIAQQLGVEMPTEVAAIIGGLVAAAASLVIAWTVPAKSGTNVDWAEDPDAFEVIEGEHPDGDYLEDPEGV